MVRTAAVYSFPAALIAVSWLRLESPQAAGLDGWWILALALAPALAPTLALRLALTVPAALTALWVAFDTPAPDEKRGFFVPVAERLADGLNGFFNNTLPFSGIERMKMHGVVMIAIFGFCLLLAHAIAARRPLVAVLAVVAGAGWAATLYPSRSIFFGAVILAGALWALAGLRATQPVTAFLAGAALILVAAAASTSSAVAKDSVLAWESWNPSRAVGGAVSVSYVWDAQYGGIRFSKKERTVLRITGPKRGLYWRATTLDQFDSDRWLDNPVPLSTGLANGRLPNDPLLPTESLNRSTWVKQEVEIGALQDQHIIGAAQPVALEAPQLGGVFHLSGGLVRVSGGLSRGERYTVYSYSPRPEPADLAQVDAEYPPGLERFFDIGRTRVEPFGTAGRDERVEALFDDERYVAIWPYQALWNQAKRLRAGARTPYGAVVAIETWLRSTGGFSYDESPPPAGGLPPLAHFVTEGKSGYCQHFAGAMALMLRFLGIPSRVAGGFTSGKRDGDSWVVTDHNAHAWVEAWFPGYGWLAFDPTPGRGSLTGNYSASSTGFNAGDAADAFAGPDGAGARGGASELERFLQRERLEERQRAGGAAADDGRPAALWLLLLSGFVIAGAIGAAKVIRRRLRYLTRDPRRLAGAARRELADFLVDQGLEVRSSATPAELQQLVRAELGADGRKFAAALAEARFGPPEKSGAAAARAHKELRGLLRVIRHGLGRTARLRGLVALRSLRA